ncbi:ArsR/SmtB family transcription factor [Brevibacillus ginsengisoli]|uniref:ArsR/SmtB family transcription factor n=1 Tax=Brevibacillus ginsengisoli TaxID=363854 RepID=UPI003CF91D56
MDKTYSVSIEFSPAYELVTSFYTYIYHSNLKNIQLGTDWYHETKQSLPQSFAEELADERWEVLHRVVLLISQCPQKTTAEQFLDWFEKLPAGELYERLAPWVSSIPLNLGELRDRSTYLLTKWNEHYFRRLEPSILTYLSDQANHLTALSTKLQPIELIDQATNGIRIEPTEQLEEVILVPQYHCAPSTILDFFRKKATCLYGAWPMKLTEETATEEFLQLAQALADEKRLRILLYLSKQACTLTEIQQHVKLAKSTVHHHMTTLRRAGMVRIHFLDHTTPSYYSLREPFIDGFHQKLKELLLHKEAEHE